MTWNQFVTAIRSALGGSCTFLIAIKEKACHWEFTFIERYTIEQILTQETIYRIILKHEYFLEQVHGFKPGIYGTCASDAQSFHRCKVSYSNSSQGWSWVTNCSNWSSANFEKATVSQSISILFCLQPIRLHFGANYASTLIFRSYFPSAEAAFRSLKLKF